MTISSAAKPPRQVRWPEVLLVAALAGAGVFALTMGQTGERAWPGIGWTYSLAAILAAGLAWQVRAALKDAGPTGLLSPVVLACVVHFFLGYVMPILMGDAVFVKSAVWSRQSDPIPLINRTLILAMVCVAAMSLAYHSRLSRNFAEAIRDRLARTGWFRSSFSPRMSMVLLMLAISLAAMLIQIRLGVFGYSSNRTALFEFAEYRRILDFSASLLTLLLFLVAMGTFDARRKGEPHIATYGLLLVVFTLHVLIGILTGFKSQVVMPAVIVGAAYFIVFRRVPLIWVGGGVGLLVLSYSVVEPFRELRNTTSSFQSTSLSSIAETALSAAEIGRSRTQNTTQRLFQRSELISPTSAALQHADTLRAAGTSAPQLLEAVVLSPVLAIAPRAVWPSKPTYQTGKWFAMAALRQPPNVNNSIGMGAISYFNYLGGPLGCFIGFAAVGFTMRVMWSGFTPLGAGGWIAYLAVLQTFATIPGDIGPALTGLLQLLPLAVLAQWLVLKE